jgi:hypothetical protein
MMSYSLTLYNNPFQLLLESPRWTNTYIGTISNESAQDVLKKLKNLDLAGSFSF